MMRKFISYLSLLCPLIGIGQTYVPPNEGPWETVDITESLGWCPDRLDSLDAFMEANGTRGLIILHEGRIAHEAYFNGGGMDSLWYWASAGKTVTSALIGILASEELLNIEDATADWLGEGWTSMPPEDEYNISIINQLTMTTGLDDSAGDPDCTLPDCLHYLEPPGVRWAYHNAPYTLLTDVISTAAGQPLNIVFFNRIRQHLGMTANYINFPSEPFNKVVVSTARDMARFGLLASRNFVWNGDSLITNAGYLSDVFNSTQPFNACYGSLWWLNGGATHMLPQTQWVFDGAIVPSGPIDLRMALGKNDQKIHISPSSGLVLIRMGESAGVSALAASSLDDQIWTHLNLMTIGCANCIYDMNNDGLVAVGDILLFLSTFGIGESPADFNSDGTTTTADLLAILGAFGSTC